MKSRGSFVRLSSLAFFLALTACAPTVQEPGNQLRVRPTAFDQLPGWTEDRQNEALSSFEKSCTVIGKRPDQPWNLVQADWTKACAALADLPADDPVGARSYFERWFTPYEVRNEKDGLFTGYYEAQLNGSWTQGGAYQTPLWTRPDDMLTADLGLFKPELKGQKITGKAQGRKFIPYDDRAAIASGSLRERARPLLWVDDPVAAFFLEIQGSGVVAFPDGSSTRIGYDGQNGRPYIAIGRVMADRGFVEKPVTMEKIRCWLKEHPEQATSVMNENPSAVFFRKTDKTGPVGAQGVMLTALRSLAVDTNFVPLGTPVWLVTENQKRLVIAQDTGGAIKGPVRGDLFWGTGAEAEAGAGPMQERGTYYLLLPKDAKP